MMQMAENREMHLPTVHDLVLMICILSLTERTESLTQQLARKELYV